VPGARVVQMSREGLVHDDAEAALASARVLLRGGVPASVLDHIIARAPRLEWIHSFSAGVDRVATPAVRERGLVVTNARGVFSRPIAEYVVMMCLAIARRLPQLLELQRERTWQPLEGRELRELTVGIVGYGSLGRSVASLASAFGARVIALRRRPESAAPAGSEEEDGFPFEPRVDQVFGPDRLHELLAASDIVVLAAPLTPETEGMIDEAAVGAMKRDAWLINVARGRLVDDTALIRALRDNRIGGAALDTFRDEPLPPGSPYWELPNVILTPHTAWSSARVLDRSIDLFCDNLVRFSRGEPLRNVVDPAAGY
jgi:phosphoglycerate dehydrogenase-like enzyme